MNDDLILYHYTNIEGLHGILRTGRVWASDCRYLNDRQELTRAIELFLSKLDGDMYDALHMALSMHSVARSHCVFSLSSSPEVLSQWRAYADDGYGVAIGFRAKWLSGFTAKYNSYMVECIYDDHDRFVEGIKKRCSKEIDDIVKMYKDIGPSNVFVDAIGEHPQSLESLFRELLRIKNPAFVEEKEFRLLINIPTHMVQTRVSRGLIIPYVEHVFIDEDLPKVLDPLIPEIWLGPKCDERNLNALHIFGQLKWALDGIKRYDCGYL